MPAPRVAVGPAPDGTVGQRVDPLWVLDAVRDGGGEPVELDDAGAEALVWLAPHDPGGLAAVLAGNRRIRWVQLPFAGIEHVAAAGLLDPRIVWTCAKGSFAEPVAEHALALALAGLRLLPERIVATGWGDPAGTSLYDQDVTIVGGGGITEVLLGLLAPFRVRATVVRRRAGALPGAVRTVPTSALPEVLPGALVVFLALALTPETTGLIGAGELAAMDRRAWLVNVARGGHVDTDALADTLARGGIAGAALDVTDPEPLPAGHRLWSEPRCIVTPHTADTWDMVQPRLAARIRVNVARYITGEPLEGLIDPAAGY